MTPSRQFAESVKYTARPVILIPSNGGLVITIMEAYGATREYICTIPSAELTRWVENDFARQRSCRALAMKPRPPIVKIDLDLFDFEL